MKSVVKMSDNDRPVARRSSRSNSGNEMNHWMYRTNYAGIGSGWRCRSGTVYTYPNLTSALAPELDGDRRGTKVGSHGEVGKRAGRKNHYGYLVEQACTPGPLYKK